MGIKYIESKNTWTVTCCARHPVSRKPVTRAKQGIKTKAEALRQEKKLILALDRMLREDVEPTWASHLKTYDKNLATRNISQKTVENTRLCLEAHTLETWGKKLISEISTDEIRELIKSKDGLSESHRKNILKFIRGCFQYSVELKLLPSNPTPNITFKIGEKLKSVLTIEQMKTLLNYAKISNHEWYPIWAMALYTGLRNGELYAITWDKVDLENRKAVIDSAWNSKDGFKDTKSGHDRMIELAPELVVLLKQLKLKSMDRHFVLPRIDRWDKGEQARELRRVLEGLGLPRIRFHDLRASWATMMLSRGIEPIKVMSMGGWRDLKTMQRYIRKAGVDISGISDGLNLHNPSDDSNIIKFNADNSYGSFEVI